MSRTYSDNKRPVEVFGSDFASMGTYGSVSEAARECLVEYGHVWRCVRCDAPRSACQGCPAFKKSLMTFRWAAKKAR